VKSGFYVNYHANRRPEPKVSIVNRVRLSRLYQQRKNLRIVSCHAEPSKRLGLDSERKPTVRLWQTVGRDRMVRLVT
jgi:hypothetical protein